MDRIVITKDIEKFLTMIDEIYQGVLEEIYVDLKKTIEIKHLKH